MSFHGLGAPFFLVPASIPPSGRTTFYLPTRLLKDIQVLAIMNTSPIYIPVQKSDGKGRVQGCWAWGDSNHAGCPYSPYVFPARL